jgi:choline dehydrogenase-like flavoprotein
MRTLDCDVVVVGSGAAGGVVAATLAERTRFRVVLLERGGHFGREFFNQREWDMSRALYAERGTRTTEDGAIPVRGGECVGGGTTVNVALSFDPVRRVWDSWRAREGLEGFSFDAGAGPGDYGVPGLDVPSCLAEVRARSNVHAPEDREINRNNALFAAGCERLGIAAKRYELNMRGCIGCGFCSAGCAYDAKQGTLVTFVPDAVARGATLVHHARVERIEYDGARATGVLARVEETRAGSRPNAVAPGPLRVRAKLVVVCAGAIESPALLLRSGHPDPHRRIGRGLVLHPSLPFIGRSPSEVAGHVGIEGTMYSDAFAASDGFYLECLFGHPLYGAAVLPGFARDHFEMMLAFRRLFGFGAMLVDESADDNRVEWDDAAGRARIHYRLTADDARRLRKAARVGVEILFAAGAEEAWIASEEPLGPLPTAHFTDASQARFASELRFLPHRTILTSAHPQATLKMGADPRRTTLSSRGETHTVKNVVVCDASAFPTSCGANPMISIMTMARYQARRIAAEAGRYAL